MGLSAINKIGLREDIVQLWFLDFIVGQYVCLNNMA